MTTVLGTLNVDQAVTFDTTLAVTGVVTLTNDLIVNGADITHGTANTPVNVMATTTAKATFGGGPVDLSDSGDMTTVLGTLNVDEAVTFDTTLTVTGAVTLGNHVVASSNGDAKNVRVPRERSIYRLVYRRVEREHTISYACVETERNTCRRGRCKTKRACELYHTHAHVTC